MEGTLSELVRAHGLRQHRYRGGVKRHCQNLLKGAACNLNRLARILAARGTGTAAVPGAPGTAAVPPRGGAPLRSSAPSPALWRLVAATIR